MLHRNVRAKLLIYSEPQSLFVFANGQASNEGNLMFGRQKAFRAYAPRLFAIALTGGLLLPVAAVGEQEPAYASTNPSAIVGTAPSSAAFLAGTYLQVGVAQNGRFGTSGVNAPAGFFPNVGGALGFRADRDRDGTFDDGDFFMPGGDFEGWAVQFGSTTRNFDNDNNQQEGTLGAVQILADSVTVSHTVTTDGLEIVQTYSVPIAPAGTTSSGDQQLSISATVRNTTGAPIADLYFARAVDPDNNQAQGCDFETTNTIEAQYGVDGRGYSLVSATQPDSCLSSPGSRNSQSYIGLFSSDPRSSVGAWKSGFGSMAAQSFVRDFDTAEFIYSGSILQDSGIGLSLSLGTLGAGESTSFSYAYILSTQAAADASSGVGGAAPESGATPTPTQGPGEPAIALDTRWVNGSPVNGAMFEIGATNLPDGSVWTADIAGPVRLIGEGVVAAPGELWRNLPLGALEAPGTYTLSYRVLLPSGETLQLRRAFTISAEGIFTDVGVNEVVAAASAVAVAERLAYTGLRSAVLPWWALTALLFGLLLIAYSLRARRIVDEAEARAAAPRIKTPWEVLATPIRVPGIAYHPQPVTQEAKPQSLGQALRDLDLALSKTVVNHLTVLSLGRRAGF